MSPRKREYCYYCGRSEELTVDHVVPLSRAREYRMRRSVLDNPSNRVPCCRECNQAKGNMSPREWLDAHPEYRHRLKANAKYLSDAVRQIAGLD